MLIANGDKFIGGPLDKIIMLRSVETGRFHVCFMEEHAFPGPIQEAVSVKIVRLISKMHHTAGGATPEEAMEHFNDMKSKIEMPEENYDPTPQEWDGAIPLVQLVENWRRK